MARNRALTAELFEAPLEEFTRRRDELAARLKDEGKSAEAAEVKKLRRPTLVAWVVNQLARQEGEMLGRFLNLQRDIGRAASREKINELSNKRRELIAEILDRATEILVDAGHSATAQTKQKLTQTLLATNSDEQRVMVKEGRLQQEVASNSFGGDAWAVPAPTRTPRESKAAERTRETVQNLTKELKEARAEVQRLTRTAQRLDAQSKEAAKRAQAQDRAAARLERRLEDARKKLRKQG